MSDRLAARHLALGALDIDVDPLMVAGRVGEFVDVRLVTVNQSLTPISLPTYWARSAGRSTSIMWSTLLAARGRPLALWYR